MKFSDGQWLMKKGVNMLNPFEVRDVKTDNESLTVFAPVKHVNDRADTIDSGLFTLRFSSPMADIIRVQIWHHKGRKKRTPEFKFNSQKDVKVEIINDADIAGLKSGNLSVKVNKKDKWSVDFYDGENLLTSSDFKSIGHMTTDFAGVHMREQLNLKVGECIYGLGERFTPYVKNGQTVDIWNEDGGTNSEQSYKNIPFYLSNMGYGVFVNHTEKVSFEVGSEIVTKVQFSVEGEYLDYFFINGPKLKDVLINYTALTGRPSLPPVWSFGLWLSTSFSTDYDEKTINSFIDGMYEREIPVKVFHFDCFWMKEYHLCDLEWDYEVFPEPEKMLARLKEKGIRICLWINPYIAQRSKLFDEGMEKGYLLMKPDGDVWQWDRWQAGLGIIDFTNPDACEWYAGYLRKLIDMGVDSFKTDFGERIPLDVVYHDGSDPVRMHNYYSYLFTEVVFNVLEEKYGKNKALVFARSGTAGSQKFPVHWGGDCWANFESMAESLRGGLSLCLSGFGYWSHDIGGFESTPTSDVYKRWIAFGLLSSHSRLHGSKSYRVPWLYDEESVDVLRFFTKLKHRLMPYIFSASCETWQKGIPVMRAMILEFQDDPSCEYLDRQYMLGDSLLVAPVFDIKGIVNYYVPEGNWTNWFTNKVIIGGKWLKEKHGFLSLPLLVRKNSIIAEGNIDSKPDYDFPADVTLHLFELENGKSSSVKVYDHEAQTELEIEAVRKNESITINIHKSVKPWKMLLRNINKIKGMKNGTYEDNKLGVMIKPDKGSEEIIIEL